jgi:hypothetical protein
MLQTVTDRSLQFIHKGSVAELGANLGHMVSVDNRLAAPDRS